MALNMPPQTPQRPTPGAFIKTPAPGRQGLFRPASTQQPQPAQLQAPPSETPLERAAHTINGMLKKDASYPSLETYIGQGYSGDYDITSSPAWTPFQKLRTYPLPDIILQQIDSMNMSLNMGLFAEINHAWITIDNQLYLWDYTHPNPEIVGYEEQPNPISCVKLVKPRAKVFVDNISYVLVVATTTDVFLIAVECQRGPEGVHSVTLYRTGLSVSVRGIQVGSIEGSAKTGRIFFADGRDSEDVYELNYQQEDKWFSSRCSKTNHIRKPIGLPTLPFYATPAHHHVLQVAVDDTRNLLYTLSSNGTIRVFYMRTPGTLDCVITTTLGMLHTMAGHHIQRAPIIEKMKLVRIDPITATEAEQMSLMVTTSTGCRLFLSTTSGGWMSDSTSAPSSMQLRHIRFPPSDGRAPPQAPGSQLQQYQNGSTVDTNSKALVHTESGYRFAPGSFFCFVREDSTQARNVLFASVPHSGALGQRQDRLKYDETGQVLQLIGNMQDVGQVTDPFSATKRPLGFGNELAVQFDKPLCEIAIMTHQGIETVRRRRLVDLFAAVIKYGGGAEGLEGDVRKIVKQYGLAETASTALAVACGQGSDVGPDSRVSKVTDPEVLEFARKVFLELGGKAHLNETATLEDLSVENVRPSQRHDGIAMYIARLVRSVWDTPVIKETKIVTGLVLTSTHDIAKLQEIQRALVQLQDFMDTNKSFIDGLAGPEALGRVTSRQDEVELQGENRALSSLVQMINNIIEGIAFVLVLFDERLEDILLLLPEESRQKVRRLTFQGLFSVKEGKDLAKDLVKAIVNRNIAKGSNVETVAEALRRKCGSFCSSDDVVVFKAQENLKKATDVGANAERGRVLLNDSLRLFEQVAQSLSFENLSTAVERYIELEFYAGAIRLALKAAQELDRGNKALSWIKDGRPIPDARQEAYTQRTQCYGLIFRVIEAVDRAFNNQGVAQEGVLSQISKRKYEAYEQINNSDDEVFQNYLYDWYLTKGWADRLLEINSAFVVDFLRRSLETDIAHADLLWRYYAHYNDYLSAAEVQHQLAQSAFELRLEKRIEYLSRAKANASTRMTGFSESGVRNRQSRQELLRNIGDLLDIANIQDDILQKMKSDVRLQGDRREQVIHKLDGAILPLDDLFHSFADQAGYYDICLLIYHSADYRNLSEIHATWTNVVEQTHQQALQNSHTAPWEMVAFTVEHIGRRVNLNENVFPVNIILQILLQYDIREYVHDAALARSSTRLLCPNVHWPINVFVNLNAPFELIVATLEAVWYAQEAPFVGRERRLVVKWIIYTVERWHDVSRRTGAPFGSIDNAIGLADCLRVVLGSGELARDSEDGVQWLERGRVVSEAVESAAR
ncbi:Non-repetitive/WGA-negative nucleoporin C-terminal-domain-containing protein [Massariosphaeria phaeospora]|uniref:Non-repetitive/WGA-negative nucleoporin C-terminal-domain-containing protein n=1 Tax=Massariosphaeria phaeospora TaxID=100035 RepID=A0A7C8MGF2_9PLEO|nr:Non-repetitive/WGA-negative nucleoporin C-terminal-domain-containing protein [Massariosphaeria phaeospora]